MKNNLEEVLKEKMSIDMSSPIKFLRTMRLSHYEIPGDFVLDMHDQLDELEQELQKTRKQLEKKINGETSDGYHTFNELYEHRFILANALFNSDKERCLKSKKHSDGTMFDNYFIVGINTAQGWATYHYHISKWDDFKCAEIELFPEWDGHTSQDAINRIDKHFKNKQGEG